MEKLDMKKDSPNKSVGEHFNHPSHLETGLKVAVC